jgi:hypothetical protein
VFVSDVLQEEELLEKNCLKTLHDRQMVTKADMEEVLNQYKLSQDVINQHRSRQRELLNERLHE